RALPRRRATNTRRHRTPVDAGSDASETRVVKIPLSTATSYAFASTHTRKNAASCGVIDGDLPPSPNARARALPSASANVRPSTAFARPRHHASDAYRHVCATSHGCAASTSSSVPSPSASIASAPVVIARIARSTNAESSRARVSSSTFTSPSTTSFDAIDRAYPPSTACANPHPASSPIASSTARQNESSSTDRRTNASTTALFCASRFSHADASTLDRPRLAPVRRATSYAARASRAASSSAIAASSRAASRDGRSIGDR
ncbi:hypothetical protein BE221DRAFT_75978, partial [Ostreococcus tauri]